MFISIGVWFALVFSSVIVCNEGFIKSLKKQSDDEYLNELIDKKKVIKEHYSAERAITFEDLSTGCLCHILEIENEKSICLYGQYLYDHVEITDEPELNQERKFPTSEFTLYRRVKDEEILRLEIGKTVIEQTSIVNPRIDNIYALGIKLKDGQIINNMSFDEMAKALN